MTPLKIRQARASRRRLLFWHLWVCFMLVAFVTVVGGISPPWWVYAAFLPAPVMLVNLCRVSFAVWATLGAPMEGWWSYKTGLSVADVRWAAKQMETYDEIKARAEHETPQILAKVEELLEDHRLMQATQAIDAELVRQQRAEERRLKEAERQQTRIESFLNRARNAGFSELVAPLVEAGNLAAAEEKLGRCLGWLEKGKSLGIEEAMRQVLAGCQQDFDAAEKLVREHQTKVQHERMLSDLADRVRRLSARDHQRINDMLIRLQELPCGSRHFRKGHHDLERELQRAEGARVN